MTNLPKRLLGCTATDRTMKFTRVGPSDNGYSTNTVIDAIK